MTEKENERRRIRAGEAPPSRGLTGWIEDNTLDFILVISLIVSAMVYFTL